MAQPKFKADMITPRANDTFIRPAAAADSPQASPARMLQDAFVVTFNLVAWSAIATGVSRLLA
jgi:hypothetical protein